MFLCFSQTFVVELSASRFYVTCRIAGFCATSNEGGSRVLHTLNLHKQLSQVRRRMKNELNHPHTLRGSFSAVSMQTFASIYLLESSWRALQDSHTFPPLRLQNFSQKSSTFFREWKNELNVFRRILHFFCEMLMKFCRHFATNSRKCRYVSIFKSNWRNYFWKFA